ncbi:hypothetical protein, partial [uncultured Butyricimonas sp.]|uniref:hypothetical protein n=1 Tax=uncultured Butyricimonas sp. TaxID=1268785 RepID=UPI0025977AE7
DKPLDFVATDISLLVEQVNFFRIRQISECVGLFGLYYFLIGVEFMLHYIFLAVILLAMLVSRVILP